MNHPSRGPACQATLLALLLFAAAATTTVEASAVRSLLEIRQQNVVIQQWDISCGAASLATILTYQFGDPVSEKKVVLGLLRYTDTSRVSRRGGFSLLDMKRYLSSRGFAGKGYSQLRLEDLLDMAPLIVPVHLGSNNHFIVFRGIYAGRVVFADPAFGNRSLPIEKFEQVWHARMGFAVQPAIPEPRRNRMLPQQHDLARVPDTAVNAVLQLAPLTGNTGITTYQLSSTLPGAR